MIRLFRNKKGQNTAEYALLIALVVAAIIAMQEYTKRALQAKVRDANVYMTNTTGNGTAVVDNYPTSTQYVPYYDERSHQVDRDSVENVRQGNGLISSDSSTVRTRSGYEKTIYGNGKTLAKEESEMPQGL